MAIIEIIGGPITHKYLMGKTKHDLADMYMRLLRETAREAEDAARYRWLRDQKNFESVQSMIAVTNYGLDPYLLDGDELDAQIDAARAGERGSPPGHTQDCRIHDDASVCDCGVLATPRA